MACNNTTYIRMVENSTELQKSFFKYAFVVEILNYNIPMAMLVNKCLTPIWLVIGIFGNIISACVWANPRMRTCNTAAYYLTCLAIADLTFLILHFIYELEQPWLLGTLDHPGWCQIFSMANMAVQYFCVFLVFAFTVERFLSVCHPFKSERFGKTRTPRTICCLLALAILLSLPQGYFWHIIFVGECQVRPTQIRMLEATFYSVYTWCTELAVFFVLPLIVLILNVAVLFKIRSVGMLKFGKDSPKGTDVHSPLTASKEGANQLLNDTHGTKRLSRCTKSGHNASNKGTTVTLLWVSFYLIFTMLPNTIMYALQPSISYGFLPCRVEDMANDPSWSTYFSFVAAKIIVKELSLSHHVGNIFIYMATSRRFVRMALQSLSRQFKPFKGETGDTSLHTIRSQHTTRIAGDDV